MKRNGKAERIKTVKTIRKLAELRPDPANTNRHTERGTAMMEDSIREVGFGDSLTVDRDGVVISGNQRLETLADLKLGNPIVVQSDGSRPIVHQRTDLAAKDSRARLLALYSNRVGEVNLAWDADMLRALAVEVGISKLFSEDELKALLGDATAPEDFKEVDENLETEHVCPKCGYRFSGGEKTNVTVKVGQ